VTQGAVVEVKKCKFVEQIAKASSMFLEVLVVPITYVAMVALTPVVVPVERVLALDLVRVVRPILIVTRASCVKQ
jgi:hypothetical protein